MNVIIPWLLYPWFTDWFQSKTIALLITIVIILLLCFKHLREGYIIDWSVLITFLVLFALEGTHHHLPDDVVRTMSFSFLFIGCLFTIIAGKPFTVKYAKKQVEEEYWEHESFQLANSKISLVWCVAFLVNSVISFWGYFNLQVGGVVLIVTYLIMLSASVFTFIYPKILSARY
ncbi:hypothetical protein [Rahnella aceris]|jgi:hypothetical protein|uniref:hypothetical protein n=1 Tax=Rahnella sp. (strain Y9602) TaxID=2703885 RepID=UPI003BA0BF6F